MRTLNSQLSTLLASSKNPFVQADLYTITLSNGTVLYWWTGQLGSFTIGGHTYLKGPLIERSKAKWSMGLNVDSMEVTIVDDGSTTINSQSIVKAAWQNMFDFATVECDRFISDTWSDTSVGTVPWFHGLVGQVQLDGKKVILTVESSLAQLKSTFPKTYVLPQCPNTLFDAVCQRVKSNYTFACTVAGSPTANMFAGTQTGGNRPDHFYQNGSVTFTSGNNNGQSRMVKDYVNGVFILVYPLYYPPAVGDTFNAVFGCDKTRQTCENRFNGNIGHYRGFPYVPDPSTQYGGTSATGPSSGTSNGSGTTNGISTRIGPRGRNGGISQF